MRWAIVGTVLMCIGVGSFAAVAQVKVEPERNVPATQTSVPSMRFSRPQVIGDINPRPTIAGRFDCDKDGTIYTFIDGYTPNTGSTPTARLALLGIHPNGNVTNFDWRSVEGFTNISLPRSVFVGHGQIFVLAEGDRKSGKEEQYLPYPLVLTFNQEGTLIRVGVLDQGLDPLVLGVFKSGNFVVVSYDRLNNRMALDLIRPDGTEIRQLSLGSNDYLAQASKMGPQSMPGKYNSTLLIDMSKFFPFGRNLLLVPLETSGLPVLNLGEKGVASAIVPQLPKGMVLDSFISTTSTSLKMRLGTVVQTQHPALDSDGKLLSVGTIPSQKITEFSLANGSIVHEDKIGSTAVQPACEADGALRLLTSSGTAGKLAVVTARMK